MDVRRQRSFSARTWYGNLSLQVLVAVVAGILIGRFFPGFGAELKPIGDAFIKLIKMVLGPVIFLTLVTGISSIGGLKKVGKVGLKALLYFEVMTTLALVIGMIVANLMKPGAGLIPTAVGSDLPKVVLDAHTQSVTDFLLGIIPDSAVGAFTRGNSLEIIFFSILFGIGLSALGERGKPLEAILEQARNVMFAIIGIIMRVAPIGAFGMIAFTVGHYGVASLSSLAALIGAVYITTALFVFVVLGAAARLYGFNLLRFLKYIFEETLIAAGVSNSISVLPQLMDKMQRFGCSRSVVGIVLPTGFMLNQDGAAIYLSMSVVFIAQIYHIDLSIGQQLSLLLILMLTSKGTPAVSGAAFVALAATLSAAGTLPMEGLALLFGIDRFMSEARAIMNVIGNGVATVIVAKMEGEFDEEAAIEEYKVHFKEPALGHI